MYRTLFLSLSVSLFFFSTLMAQDFDDLNNQAYKERDNKNYQKAIELCTQAINKKVNARSYIIRADSRYALNDFEAAITDCNSALTYYSDYYPDNKEKAGIYFILGNSKQKLGRYSDAIGDFTSALTYNYEAPAYVYWDRGACYYNSGKYKEANDDYTKAIDRISDSKDLSDLFKNRGDCEAMLGNYEAAYSLYARAITYNSKNSTPYWQRGIYKSEQKKYDEALNDFNKAIEIITANSSPSNNSDLAILYRNKALMHKNLKQYNDAITAINKSLETDPNLAKTYRIRGDIYLLLKKYDKVKADYQNAIVLQTDKKIKADIYYDRSIMEKNLLDYKSSLEDLNKAIEQNPAYGYFYWLRSILYGYKKNYVAAIRECNTALEFYKFDSLSTASLWWLRAQHKDNSGDFKGAAEDFQSYLKYYPKSYSGYYDLGRLFKMKLKNYDLANANFSKAADLAEKAKDTTKGYYIAFFKGDKETAIRGMLTRIELVKDDAFQYQRELHNMTCIYALAGNIPKAFEYLDKSLKAGFDDYLHLVNDRDLISLMKLPQWKAILTKYKVPTIKN